jgi:hypothetical protein
MMIRRGRFSPRAKSLFLQEFPEGSPTACVA